MYGPDLTNSTLRAGSDGKGFLTSGRDGSGTCKKGRVPGRVGTGSKKILKAKSTYMGDKRATNNHQLPNSQNSNSSSLGSR